MKALPHHHKEPINFRLDNQMVLILDLLEKKFHTSKTAIVESALKFYAAKKLNEYNPLIQFAGILSEKESGDILTLIHRDRRNKTIKTKI